ncbi:MAG: Fic family protein [Ruminococcus sp.]|nr:Fic family protein [Ruminococcus sp.]
MAVYKIEGCQWNCYPGTTVLINKLDIHDQAELDAVEKQITLLRATQAEKETGFVNVDFGFYRSLHGFLFGDLYDWAGSLRNINISKKGTIFCDHNEIERIGDLKFSRLRAKNYLKGLSFDEFTDELTDLYHELNMLHPFREGNGRTLRLFITLLVRNTGHDIDFTLCDTDMLNIASIKAAQGDHSLLRNVLSDIIN